MKSSESSIFERARKSLRRQGPVETALKSFAVFADYAFDIRYGLDTCRFSPLANLTIHSGNRDQGVEYQPSRIMPLKKVFNDISPIIPSDSVLVDFGCGKGRVLLVASEFGFKEVRGVEFAHELCEIAEKNCARWKAIKGSQTEYRINMCDVVNYSVKTDENVFFMFNPFHETIMSVLLSHIATSLQEKRRKAFIVYNNPQYGHIIEQGCDFNKLREYTLWGHTYTVYSNGV